MRKKVSLRGGFIMQGLLCIRVCILVLDSVIMGFSHNTIGPPHLTAFATFWLFRYLPISRKHKTANLICLLAKCSLTCVELKCTRKINQFRPTITWYYCIGHHFWWPSHYLTSAEAIFETTLRLLLARGVTNICGMSLFGSDVNKYSGTFW